MGTVFTVSIGDDIDPEILTEVSSWWEHVEQTFSTFRPDSQISAIGRGELEIEDAAVDVRHVLAVCAEFEEGTEGRFSIRPGRPGGPGLDQLEPNPNDRTQGQPWYTVDGLGPAVLTVLGKTAAIAGITIENGPK